MDLLTTPAYERMKARHLTPPIAKTRLCYLFPFVVIVGCHSSIFGSHCVSRRVTVGAEFSVAVYILVGLFSVCAAVYMIRYKIQKEKLKRRLAKRYLLPSSFGEPPCFSLY